MRQAQFTEGVPLDPRTRADRLAESALKDRDHHRKHAADYDAAISSKYAMYHRWDLHPWVARASARHRGGRALDLGAGTGEVAVALARAGFRVSALDHSREMLAVARDKRPNGTELTPCVADALRLPFADSTFDVVTIQGLLHHVPIALEEVLAETHRVLVPGGEFYVSEPASGSSIIGKLLRHPIWFTSHDPEGEETDEELIGWRRLSAGLDRLGLQYDVRFLTHVPQAHFHYWLPDWLRISLTVVLSFPYRRGDLLFVHGRKPPVVESSRIP